MILALFTLSCHMIDFTAHPLFPDLLENQRRSVQYFFEKGILEELELFSYLGGYPTNDGSKGISLKSPSLNGVKKVLNSFPLLLNSSRSFSTSGLGSKKVTKISTSLGLSVRSAHSQADSGRAEPPQRLSQRTGQLTVSLELILHASKFVFKRPQFSQAQAIAFQKTYSAGLYIPISIRATGIPASGPSAQNSLNSVGSFGAVQPLPPQWFYLGEIPLMTERGSFLINGSPRVLVNQIVRCPSVYFKLKLDEKNRRTYIASFLSDYGSWLRLETDRLRPRLWVRIDKSPRFPIDLLLTSLGGSGRLRDQRPETILNSLQTIWKKCNPGRWGSVLGCYSFFYNKFFNPRRYSLGRVGRLRLNKRLGRPPTCTVPTLTPEDVFLACDYLIDLQKGKSLAYCDDIDHLKNRRVRLPGEIIQNQFRLALSRVMSAGTKPVPIDSLKNPASCIASILGGSPPQAFGNTLRELFNTSQLSQYMDQTNPLAEITHKRRLSSLGPGGVGRDQAGFAVREIHPSHFGRICPIETPEGQNAGLVGSLASFARINPDGFLQSPAMILGAGGRSPFGIDPKISSSLPTCYLFPSDIEDEIYLCTADIGRIIETKRKEFGENFSLSMERVPTRYKQEFIPVNPGRIEFRGVCPIQLISVATSLIPFLEHDDANRALMGSNMQRQAVPLAQPEKPLVGTGLELQAARDSSTVLLSSSSGQVVYVDSQEIRVRESFGKTVGLKLQKYSRSNQSTCSLQRPAVQFGDWVERGDLLADGSATEDGEVALGKNILLAYMPWEGYNFEDAIVINERLVTEDIYSSIHLERYELDVRNMIPLQFRSYAGTKFAPPGLNESSPWPPTAGTEFLTRDLDILNEIGNAGPLNTKALTREAFSDENADSVWQDTIPTVSPLSVDQIRNLDFDGIVKPGTWIEEGSILVGKITVTSVTGRAAGTSLRTRKSETDSRNLSNASGRSLTTTPEYRLLLAILGTAEGRTPTIRLKNTSIKAGIGIRGRIIDCIIPWRSAGTVGFQQRRGGVVAGGPTPLQIFIAHKKRIQIGDKMSGRHGNKGIVSLILPPQDMPYLQDGTPVDVVLNPLGVPSRMNVGQVLETLFGLAAKYLGEIYRLMPFEPQTFGSKELSRGLVYLKLREARNRVGQQWLFDPNNPGKTQIFDGRTGEVFHQPVLVGYSYMFKLIHLVDDKIHARSTGPYSLVTQQPLGGRSKKGGQRLGEMEVWALEGFGAAYLLQEFLTVKSDEIYSRNTFLLNLIMRRGSSAGKPSRTRTAFSVQGSSALLANSTAGAALVPESFRVLVNELQSLCLSVYYNPDFRLSYPSLLGRTGFQG